MDIQRKGARQRKLFRFAYPSLAVILLVALSLAAWSLQSRPPAIDSDRIWSGTVTRGELLREVTAAGSLVAPELRAVTNRNEGVIERILVLPGEPVLPDTVLLRMSSPSLEDELATMRWDLAQAEAEEALRAVETENRQLDLVAQVAAAESEYLSVRLELEAQEALGERQVFSAIEVERTRLRAEQLNRRLEAERARLARYAENREAEAQASNARLSRLREQVQRLEARVNDLDVTAGVEGVVQEINVQEGERLPTGQAVARVVNLDHLIARVRVAERDAANVMPGMPVRLELGQRIETGEVARIDPTARERTVSVDVALTGDQLEGLRPDLSVTARIELERVPDTLTLGRPAGVRGEFERLALFRLNGAGDRAERTEVEIGRLSTRQVEILSGLAPGDRVILADLHDWADEPVLRIR
ncbi:MAG: HlyD family efflux transporter periplasmic adaptor subunit [Wenzhouxiangella sp.]|nr:HlyD family efflux transporter periplasmic adaptor subunit [Wenzhouxiangella sp.]